MCVTYVFTYLINSQPTGDGLREVKQYLIENAKPANWMFPKNVWTDKAAEDIIQSAVKAKMLDFLPQEIPYLLSAELEYFNINSQGDSSQNCI